VLITGMRAPVQTRLPLSTEMVAIGHGGENSASVGKGGFDLDEPNPVARIVPDARRFSSLSYFGEFTITLADDEQQVFQVIATRHQQRRHGEWWSRQYEGGRWDRR
jgi:hypothetical protein